MRIALLLFSFLFVIGARAEEQNQTPTPAPTKVSESRMKRPVLVPDLNQLQIYPLALEMRYEKDASDNYLEQKPMNLSFAYRRNSWSVLFEYSKFSENSGNQTLNIDREHKEMVLWGRWHLWRFDRKALRISIYGAGGLGTYTEDVTTTLSGTSEKDSTGAKFMGGFAAGADVSYGWKSFGFIAAAEGRGLMGQDFDPNPIFGGVARTGVYYTW